MKTMKSMIKRMALRKLPGILSVEIAISPWTIFFAFIFVLVFIIVIYYGLVYVYFALIIQQGARVAAVNPDVFGVQLQIFDAVTGLLSEERSGVSLFQLSDVSLNATDGDYVTVRAVYHVLLPGHQLYERLGGNPANMVVDAPVKFSFFREYD